MTAHSIFSKQWWAVSLRGSRVAAPAALPRERLNAITKDISIAIGGTFQTNPKVPKIGLSIASSAEQNSTVGDGVAIAAVVMVQTDRVYFPLAEENLEAGVVPFDKISDCERDFPRRLRDGKTTLFQYPMLIAFSRANQDAPVYVVASPYFLLLKDVLNDVKPGKAFTLCLGLDVERAFSQLKSAPVKNGEVTVRSGRMLITGIEFLRSAVFFGENVIASPLYSQLTHTDSVTVHPKDCRLRRRYDDPVGGNCRPFTSWFDPHGNFRFTPGCQPTSSMFKFLELLDVLTTLKLVRDAETFNPLKRLGMHTQTP